MLEIEDHTTHELYIDGEKKRLNIDYNFTNGTINGGTSSPTLLLENPIATTDSSSVVTVTHKSHGYSVGDYVNISGSTAINNINASNININISITSVVDKDSYTINLDTGIITDSLLLNYESWNYSGSGNWLNQVDTAENPGVIDGSSGITYETGSIKSFLFTRVDNKRINCGNVNLNQDWSFEIWVKFNNLAANQTEGILGHGTKTAGEGLQIDVYSGGTRTYFTWNQFYKCCNYTPIENDTWVHLYICILILQIIIKKLYI